jgi:hypothetical protein
MISFALAGLGGPVLADDALHKVAVGTHIGYVLSAAQAEAQKTALIDSFPGRVKVDGFWSPPEQDVAVADRAFRDLIKAAVKDPTILFPDLSQDPDPNKPDTVEYERRELSLVLDNYDSYQRQYVGLIVDGIPIVFCNYSDGPKFDASAGYIFMQKSFVPGGSVHFLQCRFEPILKTCSNVSLIGTWQTVAK